MAEVVLVDGDGVVWHLPNNRQMCHHWGGGRIIGGYDRFGDSDTDIGVMMEPDSFRGGIFMVSNVLPWKYTVGLNALTVRLVFLDVICVL